MMKKGYTSIQNKILYDRELSDTGVRMLMLIKHLIDTNPNYEISRQGIAYEWKRLRGGKPSKRTFERAWNELKAAGYLHKYDIKMGGLEGFGCSWELRADDTECGNEKTEYDSNNEDSTLPIPQNEEVEEIASTSSENNIRLDNNKKTNKTKDSLVDEVQGIYDAYVTAKCKRAVKINNSQIVKSDEITSRFLECEEKGIKQEVIQRVVQKITSYIDQIRHKTSYITAALFNAVKEYSSAANTSTVTTTSASVLATKPTTMPITKTKFHNFEQRDTDYDALLRKLNPSYI